MPLSTFDGEPTVHEHYDPDGNLTGTTVIPGWSDDDRAWALGLSLRDANRCPRGHDLTESLDYESWKWIANDPAICWACVVEHDSMKRNEKHNYRAAMLHSVHKVPRPKRAKRGR